MWSHWFPGPQTLWGYQLYNRQRTRVGLAAGVGSDLPAAHAAWLHAMGADTSGLLDTPGRKTPRAWQVCEADGRRTQVRGLSLLMCRGMFACLTRLDL